MSADEPDIEAAYGLQTPADSRRLYAAWAESYDSSFVTASVYQLHLHTAQIFAGSGGAGPVLDVGAGTGICGQALHQMGIAPVDATDISAEMLATARAKDVYRDLFEADLTVGLPMADGAYGGVVSSGTFTHGHVGPEALDEVLRIAGAGARFALSINAAHYVSAGFEAKLAALEPQICELRLPEVEIYGDGAEGPHAEDTAFVACFIKR